MPFGIGWMEISIALLVAVLLFGGRLPEMARNMGRALPAFKKGLNDFQGECDQVIKEAENGIK